MDTVSQIKQKLDIADVIGTYINLKKAGRNYKTTCPFHSEDTPSFMISPELQIYKCFGCGEGGDMFSFVQKIEGVDFARSVEILADKAGIKIERNDVDPNYKKKKLIYEINNVAMRFYHHLLVKHPAGKEGLDYLKEKRKLNNQSIDDFMVGFAPDKWDTLYQFLKKNNFQDEDIELSGVAIKKKDLNGYIDKFRGRVMFPLIDISGKVVGFTGRDIVGRDPKYLNTQDTLVFNKSTYLYGLDKAKVEVKKQGAVFVEGQLDVITAYQHGIKNVIASSGTALTSLQLRILSRYTKNLILCFDPDTAGMAATARALDLTNKLDFEVKVAIVPTKYADLDEFLKAEPKEAKTTLTNPVPIYDFYLVNALKNYDKESAYGKKKIVEYLVPLYSNISNNVVKDHYTKKLAEKIGVSEDIIRNGYQNKSVNFDKSNVDKASENSVGVHIENSPEEFILSLLTKLDVDTIGSYVYKLSSQDFISDRNRQIFTELKKYLKSKPEKFDIKYFTEVLSEEHKEIFLEMYLWDFGGEASNQTLVARNIESAISRLKKETVKRKLKELTEQIKLAELEKNTNRVKELSQEFKKLSEKLV